MFTMRPCPFPDKGQKRLGDGNVPDEVTSSRLRFQRWEETPGAACGNNARIVNQPRQTVVAHLTGTNFKAESMDSESVDVHENRGESIGSVFPQGVAVSLPAHPAKDFEPMLSR